MGGEYDFILVSWRALAFVFAVLPGIVGIAHCFECGQKRKRPSPSGYMAMFALARKAKNEAYRKTAEAITSSSNTHALPICLAWAFALVVTLVGPDVWVTVVCLVLCIPASAVAYCIGRRGS